MERKKELRFVTFMLVVFLAVLMVIIIVLGFSAIKSADDTIARIDRKFGYELDH